MDQREARAARRGRVVKRTTTHPLLRGAEGVVGTFALTGGDAELLGALGLEPVSATEIAAPGGNRNVVKVRVSVDPADAPADAREEAGPC